MMGTRLTTRRLAAQVEGRTIVRDVDLDFEPGTVTAIIGLNGSGKSTLLRAIAGISRPAAGDVFLDDVPLRRLSARQRARQVSFVAQEDSPPGDLLVRELVALGRTPYGRPWDHGGEDEHRIVMESLDRVDMSDYADRPCSRLSGGERRRVMLARGLAQQHYLLALIRDLDQTVVVAIHDLTLTERYADHVAVLAGGRVLTQGPPHDVFTRGEVSRAFGMRLTRHVDPITGLSHLLCDPASHGPLCHTHPTDTSRPESTSWPDHHSSSPARPPSPSPSRAAPT